MKPKILVIGERGIDKFVYCKTSRLAPDRPVPVLIPEETVQNNGLAANFEENLRSMFPETTVFYLSQEKPIIKTRFVEKNTNHYFFRLDENDEVEKPLTIEILDAFLKQQEMNARDFDAIAISDYGKGFVTQDLIMRLSLRNKMVFADTKHSLGYWSHDIFCVKINNKEWNDNIKDNVKFPACKNLIVTRGAEGADYNGILYKSHPVELIDSSGLGDVFFAVLVGSYVEGKTFEEIIPLANKVCSIAAQKRGVNIMTQKDLEMAQSLLIAKI
jgi:bifunctional ADP-heptose synthase (sugar kinase/adenylyltransferase)